MLAKPVAATEANREGTQYVLERMEWWWKVSPTLLKDHRDNENNGDLSLKYETN